MFDADILRHRREIQRAIRNHKYERADNGRILIPSMHASIGGVFDTWINGQDHCVDPNLIPTAGLNHVLDAVVHAGSQIAAWYAAPFSGNYTPVAGLTAASFLADATEYTTYDESTREVWTPGAISGGSVSNSASKFEFTISTGRVNDNLYGIGILSASAKSSTSGTCLAATRFSAVKVVNATDVLAVQYTLTLTSS